MPLIILLLFIISTSSSFAYDYKEDLNRINQDLKEFTISTEKNELLLGITLTSLSFFLEKDTSDLISKNKSSENKFLADLGNIIGNPFIDFVVPITIYGISEKNTKLAKSSFSAGESVFFFNLNSGGVFNCYRKT